jgi:hypothetical protein
VEEYVANLALAQEVRADLETSGVPIRDMTDVQSLIFVASQERKFWLPPSHDHEAHSRSRAARAGGSQPYLSIASCLGKVASYMPEWIEFHRLVGAERFFLYNNLDRALNRQVLQPYVDQGIVVLHDWPMSPPMTAAYNHCLEEHRHDARWIAFIDIDEFLFSPTGRPLSEILVDYERWPGVGVDSLVFGSSGHRSRPAGLVLENYVLRTDDAQLNSVIKSIVDPTRTARCISPHNFEYSSGLAVDENHYPIAEHFKKSVTASRIRINHYGTKSRQEWQEKMKTPHPQPARPDTPRTISIDYLDGIATTRDETILTYVPALREALARAPLSAARRS